MEATARHAEKGRHLSQTFSVATCYFIMGRKRDLKNFDRRPAFEDLTELSDWGEYWNQMTTRRRTQNERHKPNKRT